jgi:light-regulated signal transduction histidine kinase (bacteriophytochrome)
MGRELVGKRKNGTTFPIDLAVSEVDLGDRKLFSGIVRDITFRKEAEEELMRSNKDLEEFAYIASHDLKAPLRRVSLCADFLEKDYEDKLDDKAKEFLEIMTKSTARMQDMIESLLKYSLIGRDGQDFENVDLNEVVDAAKQSLCVVIEESDSEIKCDELPCVTGSKSLLIQLFQNLIGNAVKYVEKGTKPKVEISVEEKDGQWIFSISDNGVGIEPQYAEQIFQIFRRLHGDDEYTGTGIGLSLCQRIVASHDGKIWLDTSYTGGCRFCFTLSSVC